MSPKEMVRTIGAELEHIPKWPGEHQNDLRMAYNMARRMSLGRKAGGPSSPAKVMAECIKAIRACQPDAEFNYDAVFFAEP